MSALTAAAAAGPSVRSGHGSDRSTSPSALIEEAQVVASAEREIASPHEEQHVAGLFGIHRHAALHVGHEADARDEQRRRDPDRLAGLRGELVVQRVLAGDERRRGTPARRRSSLGAARTSAPRASGSPQLGQQKLSSIAMRSGIGADAHEVAHALVDRGERHEVGIGAEARGQPVRDGEAAARLPPPAGSPPRRRARRRGADQRLDHRAALHLVVVLADDPVLGGDVRMREQREQGVVGRRRRRRARTRHGRRRRRRPRRLARRVRAGRRAGTPSAGGRPRRPRRAARARAPSVPKWPRSHASTSSRRQIAASASTFSGGTASTMRSCASVIQISVGAEPGVLERRALEVHLGAERLAHLADRAREAAGAAVGDRAGTGSPGRGRARRGSRRASSSR